MVMPPPSPRDDELKLLTVLIADLVGSTELVADVSPDEAQLRLTPAVEAMSRAVREFQGTISRIMGDGILAFFGAPLSQEDHALRACCAACRMHEAAAQLRVPVHLRVGLASGPALLSANEEAAQTSYVGFGVTIHLAARLESIASPGSTLCSSETMRLAGRTAEMLPIGRRSIRGIPTDHDVFELIRIRRGGPRFDTITAPELSPYVGRGREQSLLRRCADTARAGSAVMAEVVGDAGVGKSRLVWEFARSLSPRGWQVLHTEAISYGRATPYLLIASLLRCCFRIEEHDNSAAAVDKIGPRLAETVGKASPAATALLSLLDLPLGDGAAQWDMLDPLRRRDLLRDSVCELLQCFAARLPILIVVEDLHWADEGSLRVLAATARVTGPIFLLVTYRTGFEPCWTGSSAVGIGIGPLTSDEAGQLMEQAFPGLSETALRCELIARSGGNPFFLEELARSTHDSRSTQESGGAGTIPASIEAVLAERIDRLSSDDKRLLRAAAALGKRFSLLTLQRMFGERASPAFHNQLERLRDAGLLRADRQTDAEGSFAHALIQEVAYNGLPRGTRRSLHARIARTIANADALRVAEQAETLAFHAFRGEVWDQVVEHARQAGRRAAARSAYREAAAFFDQAVIAYEHLPSTGELLGEQIDLRFELRNALIPTSEISKSLGQSQQAEQLALKLGDRRRLGWATAFHARDLTLVGRPSDALNAAHRALDVAGCDGDLVIATRSYVALAAYSQGDYTRSAAIMRELVQTVEARDRFRRLNLPGPAAVFFRGWLAWALARTGQAEEADAVTRVMREFADETEQPLCSTVAHLSRGFALAFADSLEDAREELQSSLALCKKWELFAWFTNIAACLGHVLSRLGDHENAIDLLKQAIERSRASGIRVSHAHDLAWLADALNRRGNHAEAIDQANEAIIVARSHEERGNEALATAVLAEALMQTGRRRESAAQLDIALRIAANCRMAPLVARCQAGRSILETAADNCA